MGSKWPNRGIFRVLEENAFLLLALFRVVMHEFGWKGQCRGMAKKLAGHEILRFR